MVYALHNHQDVYDEPSWGFVMPMPKIFTNLLKCIKKTVMPIVLVKKPSAVQEGISRQARWSVREDIREQLLAKNYLAFFKN